MNYSKLFSIIILCLIFSCKKNIYALHETPTKKPIEIDCKDEKIITNSGFYLLSPNTEEIDSLKNVWGEDHFFTIADDINFYIAEKNNLLSPKELQAIDSHCANFIHEHYIVNKKNENLNWIIIEYEKGSIPKTFSLSDFYIELSSVDPKGLNTSIPSNKGSVTYQEALNQHPNHMLLLDDKVYETQHNMALIYADENEFKNNNKRILYLYEKSKDKYKLLLKSDNVIPCLKCAGGAQGFDSFSDFSLNDESLSFKKNSKLGDSLLVYSFVFKKLNKDFILDKYDIISQSLYNDQLNKKEIKLDSEINLNSFNIYNFPQ